MFVLVDLEWVTDEKGHYEPTQLAAIRVNQDWDGIWYFNSFIKPTFAKIHTRACATVRTCFCTEILCAPPPRGEIFTHIAK